MRSLKEYLIESKKTYKFKVGVAGDVPEKFAETLSTMMQKYGLVSLSKGKRTPIQERPLDFPNLQNLEVTFFDLEVNYPTTEGVLQEYIATSCTVSNSHLIVRNAASPVVADEEAKQSETYEALLTNEELGGESAQDAVGPSRLTGLFKELEAARKEKGNDADSGFKLEAPTAEPQNNKSVVGN